MKFIAEYRSNGVVHIQLNRPEVRNAINLGLIDELLETFLRVEEDNSIRVIMVSGAGEKAFSSGGDLQEFHAITTIDAASAMMQRAAVLLNTIAASTKLTIAAINGYALGGGAELSTAFDIRIASQAAKIGFVQSTLGITSAWGGGSRLITLIGRARALPLLLSGEILPAEAWYQFGYVDKVYPQAMFWEQSKHYAEALAKRSLEVIQAYKSMCQHGVNVQLLQSSIAAEMNTAAKLWVSEEHMQAANRFMNKK